MPSKEDALEFVRNVALPPPPKPETFEHGIASFEFDDAKDQAVIAGSDIISFVKGVTEERRQDIVNCALLAQLVATQQVPNTSHVFKWYDKYFDTLTRLGWVIQDRSFSDHVASGQSLEVNKEIVKLAAILLGPQAAALQVIKSTLDALQSMDKGSPWIKLFGRESEFAKNARFQVTLAEEASDGQFLVSLLAFRLVAQKTVTQVLFFKFGSSDVRLKHASSKVTINNPVLDRIRDEVKRRLEEFADDFIRGLDLTAR